MSVRTLLFLLLPIPLFIGVVTVATAQQEEAPPGKALNQFLTEQFFAHLDRRRDAYEQVKTAADCEKWITERKAFFSRQLGGFPQRTALHPEIVGELQGEGYRVQKVLFESRPSHHVTANLYLPESTGPYPAVLIPCGHSHNGKAAGWYQRMGILLARNGMAALCYDPIGQGERYQALDPENEHETFPFLRSRRAVPHPRVRFLCTIEHTLMGQGCILLGSNVAQFRIWDGMRAIDYLQGRDDIIADKIGCTGNSGGGTLTSYLMALDDRIVAAAPGCYLTTFRRLIETRGPQDAEQNIFGQIGFGMDEPDYVMMHAPKPTLILSPTRDATFDIDGAWDLFRQSKRFYTRLGVPERVSLCEPDTPHGMYPQVRQATARWMHRWLLDGEKAITEFDWDRLPDPISDEKLRELSEGDWTQEELYCTPEGQVMLMKGERSVFEINAAQESALVDSRSQRWRDLDAGARRSTIRATIGGGNAPAAKISLSSDAIDRDGYRIEHLTLSPPAGSGIPLQAIAVVPSKADGAVRLQFPDTELPGADQISGTREILEAVRSGTVVVLAELRGIGSTEPQHDKGNWGGGRFGSDLQEIFLAYLNGDSFVGMRVADIEMWRSQLQDRYASRKIELAARGEAAIPALHAAALATDPFSKLELRGMIPSWRSVVAEPESENQLVNVAHGALLHYDLPDLIDMVGTDKVSILESVDVRGEQLSK